MKVCYITKHICFIKHNTSLFYFIPTITKLQLNKRFIISLLWFKYELAFEFNN